MAVPTVLHEIHCLRTIRESFFPERYPITAKRYPHEPGEMNVHIGKWCPYSMLRMHVLTTTWRKDHCIDG